MGVLIVVVCRWVEGWGGGAAGGGGRWMGGQVEGKGMVAEEGFLNMFTPKISL